MTQTKLAVSFLQPRGARTCTLNDLVLAAQKHRLSEAGPLIRTVLEGGLVDHTAHDPVIFAALTKHHHSTDALSLATLLAACPAYAGAHVPTLAAALDRYCQPDHAGESVVIPGRLTQIDDWLAQHAQLRWNQMGEVVEVNGRRWSDQDTAAVRLALEQAGVSPPDKPCPNGDIEQRVHARAQANAYHPVADYLARVGLTWDRQPRLDALWGYYFGCGDCELNRALSRAFGLAMVRRVFWPGVMHHLMPVLLSPQGQGKSSGLRTLVQGAHPDAFCEAAYNATHRAENAMTLAGCWLWEIPELEGFDRADQNQIKAFVSREADDVLLPYARAKTKRPRRSCLAGTTNEQQCLKDPTGSRRYPVLAVGAIRQWELARDRDQLWAEAVVRALGPELHYLEPRLEAALADRNAEHEAPVDEVLLDCVERWLARPIDQRGLAPEPGGGWPASVTLRQVAQLALPQGGSVDERRLGRVLVRCGCRLVGRSRGDGGARTRRYAWPG